MDRLERAKAETADWIAKRATEPGAGPAGRGRRSTSCSRRCGERIPDPRAVENRETDADRAGRRRAARPDQPEGRGIAEPLRHRSAGRGAGDLRRMRQRRRDAGGEGGPEGERRGRRRPLAALHRERRHRPHHIPVSGTYPDLAASAVIRCPVDASPVPAAAAADLQVLHVSITGRPCRCRFHAAL